MFTGFKNWKVTKVFFHFKWPWWLKKNSQYFSFTLAVNIYTQLHYMYGHLGGWHLTFLAAESFVVLVCQQPTEVVRGRLRPRSPPLSSRWFPVGARVCPCMPQSLQALSPSYWNAGQQSFSKEISECSFTPEVSQSLNVSHGWWTVQTKCTLFEEVPPSAAPLLHVVCNLFVS